MATMTHRERVLAAVGHQETDRTPIDFGGTLATTIVPSTYEKLKNYLGEMHKTNIGWTRHQLVMPDEAILRRFDVDTRFLKLGDYDKGKAWVLLHSCGSVAPMIVDIIDTADILGRYRYAECSTFQDAGRGQQASLFYH